MAGILSLGFGALGRLGGYAWIVVAAFVWIVALAIWLTPLDSPGPAPAFHDGEVATMKLDGTKVMILSDRCSNLDGCRYWVRVPSSLAVVSVQEIELTR